MSATAEYRRSAAVRHKSSAETLERELAYLSRALEAVQRRRNYPLDRAQYLLLRVLEDEGPQSIATLACRLLLDGSTVTRQIAAMEAQGLINRHQNPNDGRSILVYATRQGISIAARMKEMRLDRITKLFGDWSGTEREMFAKLLTKFNASLNAKFNV
jgi:DNA-binding MarR family transcriptional regulator